MDAIDTTTMTLSDKVIAVFNLIKNMISGCAQRTDLNNLSQELSSSIDAKQPKIAVNNAILKGGSSNGDVVAAVAGTDYALPSSIPYSYYTSKKGELKDRAFNFLTFDGTSYDIGNALYNVTPAIEGHPRDLIIVAESTETTPITFTEGLIKGDTPVIDRGNGEWLISFTEYKSNSWFCRQQELVDA